jgi:restriction system protein
LVSSDWEREQRRLEREAEQQRRAEERERIARERAEKKAYVERRAAEVDQQTAAIEKRVDVLQSLLKTGLDRPAAFDLASLKEEPRIPKFRSGGLETSIPLPSWDNYEIRPPGFFGRVFGAQQRYEDQLEAARKKYARDQAAVDEENSRRRRALADKRRKHEADAAKLEADCRRKNAAVDDLQQRVEQREKQAVEEFLSQALLSIPLPRDFPRRVELAYSLKAAQLLIRAELPGRRCVPEQRAFQYVQNKDLVKQLPRPPREVAILYRAVVSQVALMHIRTALQTAPWLNSVAFNGHVATVNPARGTTNILVSSAPKFHETLSC